MTIPADATVYCDANFLVAYGAKETKQPETQKRAQVLFAELLSKGCRITASPLSFDEAWNGVRKEAGPKKIFSLPLVNSRGVEFSYSDILSNIKSFTNNLLASPKFMVIQFPSSQEKTGVNQSLNNMDSLKLKPRDSFHLSVMQLNNIQHIITRDKNFSNKIKGLGINIVPF